MRKPASRRCSAITHLTEYCQVGQPNGMIVRAVDPFCESAQLPVFCLCGSAECACLRKKVSIMSIPERAAARVAPRVWRVVFKIRIRGPWAAVLAQVLIALPI